MPKRIPIHAVKGFALEQDCTQVIVAAWDGERTHITTWGKTIVDCDQAAMGGDKIKDALGWPADLRATPSRVKALQDRAQALELAMREACDLLAERTHGSPARSAGHNARIRLETALGDKKGIVNHG